MCIGVTLFVLIFARTYFEVLWQVVRKFFRAKICKLNILINSIQKVFVANNLREFARKFVLTFEVLWNMHGINPRQFLNISNFVELCRTLLNFAEFCRTLSNFVELKAELG